MLPEIRKLIETHRTKRDFMRAVATVFGSESDDYERIGRAYDDSSFGHRRQRRESGERYFRHVLAVTVIILLYLRIHDSDLIIASLFHDLFEDHRKKWPLKRIRNGYGDKVARLVSAVTKPNPKKYGADKEAHSAASFDKVARGGFGAIVLKLADRLHNMLTLWGSPEKKHRKIYETLQYVVPLAVQVSVLVEELILAIAEQIKSKHINDNEDSRVGQLETSTA